MKKIIIIVPYFGNFPSYFKEFYKSCQENTDVDFLLITDQNIDISASNFFVWNIPFEKFRDEIQKKFDFPIELAKPYKLCDYKPAYGYVLQDRIENYDFWGYCDIDVVFGNLRKFVTKDVLQNFDKIYQNGHLTLYKNTPKINKVFMNEQVGMNYKEVFQSKFISVFDEYDGIQKKFDFLKLRSYKSNDFADISIKSAAFKRVDIADTTFKRLDNQVYIWDKGTLYECGYIGDNLINNELAYIHFQKRNLKSVENLDEDDRIIVTKNGFERCTTQDVSKLYINKNNHAGKIEQLIFFCKYKKYIWKRRLKKHLFRR